MISIRWASSPLVVDVTKRYFTDEIMLTVEGKRFYIRKEGSKEEIHAELLSFLDKLRNHFGFKLTGDIKLEPKNRMPITVV